MGIIDITALGQKTIVDSADLGKHSQIQSLAINSKANTIGLSTFDGRSNITGITKSPNGGFSQVFNKLNLESYNNIQVA